MINDINLATNAELKEMKAKLEEEFEETKLLAAKHLLRLEELEKQYMDIESVLNKRLKK